MDAGIMVAVTLVVVVTTIGYGIGARVNAGRVRRWRQALRDAFPRAGRAQLHQHTPAAFRLQIDYPVAGVSSVNLGAFPVPREMLPIWGFWAMTQSGNVLSLSCDLEALPATVGRISDLDEHAARENEADRKFLERLAAIAREAGHVMLLETRILQPRLSLVIAARGTPEVIAARLPSMLERLALGIRS